MVDDGGRGARGGDPMAALLADLERQAEGLHLVDREFEVDDLARAQYAEITLAARLHAAVGTRLRVRLAEAGSGPGQTVEGVVEAVGAGWISLVTDTAAPQLTGMTWVVVTASIAELSGLVGAAVPETARPAVSRLSIRSVLRPYAEDRERVVARLADGGVREGSLLRVGADFVELGLEGIAGTVVIPLSAVAAVGVRG